MTRDEAYAELKARFERDFDLNDYCIGEKCVTKLLEQFKADAPIPPPLCKECWLQHDEGECAETNN